jgi:N-methylhydantoinase B
LTRPWGVLGGEPGGRSEKILRRADGTEERLPSKCDQVVVEPGDMLVFRTAGGGGWKDRLDRSAEIVARDVSYGLVSREHARTGYGVVLAEDGTVDTDATDAERSRQREKRGDPVPFDFGPPTTEVIARCKEETGLEPPSPAKPLRWSPLEDGAAALARVRLGDGIAEP